MLTVNSTSHVATPFHTIAAGHVYVWTLCCLIAVEVATVLHALQAKDLASIGCCCTELRHTAGSDTLWQPLFEQDSAPIELRQYDITQAGRLGWQRVYALRRAEQYVP